MANPTGDPWSKNVPSELSGFQQKSPDLSPLHSALGIGLQGKSVAWVRGKVVGGGATLQLRQILKDLDAEATCWPQSELQRIKFTLDRMSRSTAPCPPQVENDLRRLAFERLFQELLEGGDCYNSISEG